MFPLSIGLEAYPWLDLTAQTLIAAASVVFLMLLTGPLRIIPHTRVGIAEKLSSPRGSVTSDVIAPEGQAGYQPDVMRGGLQFMMPLQYRVHVVQLVTIPKGEIGYVFAHDGRPLP